MPLTVGGNFTILNNTPGSNTIGFLPSGPNVFSVSSSSASPPPGGTTPVTVTFAAGFTSGTVTCFQIGGALAGTAGQAGHAGANGLL